MSKRLAIDGGRPVRDTLLIFGSPRIEQAEIDEVIDSLRSGWISTGPKVARFEEAFRNYIGTSHALALHSCTAGLHLSLIAAGIGPGDEVIVPPMTFAATANVVCHVGARPCFVDVEPRTGLLDPAALTRWIETHGEVRGGALIDRRTNQRVRAMIPVHLYGHPCDMDALLAIASKYGLTVIEDAAHATEAWYRGRKIGTIGDATVFSFYVTKNLVTGEGGMVTTNRSDWADRIQMYGLHGMSKGAWRRYSDEGFKHYQVVYPGYKYNMMDIQAAIGLHQLPRLEEWLKRREEIWRRYDEAFADLPVALPPPAAPHVRHARHLYTLQLDLARLKADRDTVQEALYREGIGTGIHFVALHLHPFYRDTFGHRRGDFPQAEHISNRTISLPLSAKLTDRDVGDVIAAVGKVLASYTR